jgi:alkylhydroperoxidase/carboxymuconolactone decarboxylase family protein YurZ
MTGIHGASVQRALSKRRQSTSPNLGVLAALRLESGVPFHVGLAKQAGASRDEVVNAILVGLPAAGNAVIQSLPAALAAYDAS